MNKVTLTKKQKLFLLILTAFKIFCGGRGSGKSFLIGADILQKAIALPQSIGALVGPTLNQLKGRTLRSVEAAFSAHGLVRNVHYTIGIKPPAHFKRPHIEIEDWTNVICFYWGSAVELCSMRVADSMRGSSYAYLIFDEAGLINFDNYSNVCLPTLRGWQGYGYTSKLLYQVSLYSSIPQKPEGYWFLDLEKQALEKPKDYFWLEANIYDNPIAWNHKQIELLRNEMGHLRFSIEVMNIRSRQVEEPYYVNFDYEKHTYTSSFNVLDDGTTYPTDIDVNKPLEISFDFGGWFNCCTVWQKDENEGVERCVGNFYVKGNKSLRQLVVKVCDAFKHHKNKKVIIYGEPRGHDNQPAADTHFSVLEKCFQEYEWRYSTKAPRGYRTPAHTGRHEIMNEVFGENRRDLPRLAFNQHTASETIYVMQTTQKNPDGSKYKRHETIRTFPQEKAPHLGDTVDYFVTQKYRGYKRKDANAIMREAIFL